MTCHNCRHTNRPVTQCCWCGEFFCLECIDPDSGECGLCATKSEGEFPEEIEWLTRNTEEKR